MSYFSANISVLKRNDVEWSLYQDLSQSVLFLLRQTEVRICFCQDERGKGIKLDSEPKPSALSLLNALDIHSRDIFA